MGFRSPKVLQVAEGFWTPTTQCLTHLDTSAMANLALLPSLISLCPGGGGLATIQQVYFD